jgi:hypothetical protein
MKEKAIGDGVATWVATPADRMLRILADGRMKTAHEAKSTAGAGVGGYLKARKWYEDSIMGIGGGKAVKRADRPVYGHRTTEEGLSAVSHYGDVHIRLKPETESRTSVTWGDSLNHFLTPTMLADVEGTSDTGMFDRAASLLEYYTDPKWKHSDIHSDEDRVRKAANTDYVEAQIHGGVRLEDIDHVVVDMAAIESDINSLLKSKSYYHPPSEWQKMWVAAQASKNAAQNLVQMLKEAGIDAVVR